MRSCCGHYSIVQVLWSLLSRASTVVINQSCKCCGHYSVVQVLWSLLSRASAVSNEVPGNLKEVQRCGMSAADVFQLDHRGVLSDAVCDQLGQRGVW